MKYDKLTRNMQKWPKNTMELGKIQICICGIILELGLTASRWTLTIKLSQFHWGYWQMWHASVHCELHVSKQNAEHFVVPASHRRWLHSHSCHREQGTFFGGFWTPKLRSSFDICNLRMKCFHFRPTHIFLGLYTSSWKGSVFFLSWKWQILQLPFYRRFYG